MYDNDRQSPSLDRAHGRVFLGMNITEAHELTATEGLKAMENGDLTAEGWLKSCFERIDARENAVLAWEYLDRDGALKHAQAIDKSGNGGIVAGMPFGVKDIIDTADMPTSYASPIHKDHLPRRDAGYVATTRGAGGVLLGKTVSTEFGHRSPGKTRNPLIQGIRQGVPPRAQRRRLAIK